MQILDKLRLSLFICLCLVFFQILNPVSAAVGVKSSAETDKKLAEISERENEALKDLFILEQEINALENIKESLSTEIEGIKQEITHLEDLIKEKEHVLDKKQNEVKKLLQSYQKMGPVSYLKIILESENLTSFLRRINVLRDLTRNMGQALDELQEAKQDIGLKKAEVSDRLAAEENKQKELIETLEKKYELRLERENYLASLKEERGNVEESLVQIQKNWDELKPLFPQISKEFVRILETGDLPSDAMTISFSLLGIKGTIEDKTLNNLIAANSSLPGVILTFKQGIIDMEIPDRRLLLTGSFAIQDKKALVFKAEKGSFYGMPLEAKILEDLFQEGNMVLDLSPLLGDSTLNSVKVLDGKLELTIIPVLFR
jgi:peptidoglycan hydrolase CwlO-like protein